MFAIFLVGATLLAFGGIALASSTTPTGNKVQPGDSVFVPPSALSLVDVTNANDSADLSRFLAGFIQTSIKVTRVIPTAGTPFAIGTVIGLSPPVKFPLANVTLIERDGQQFT